MKPAKIYNIEGNLKLLIDKTLVTTFYPSLNQKAYQFDFPQSKKTILLLNKSYQYETVPACSVILIQGMLDSNMMLMGEIKNNKLYGLKINGYKPWACGEYFMTKNIKNPENDIVDLMDFFWNSTFPYYHNSLYSCRYCFDLANLKLI